MRPEDYVDDDRPFDAQQLHDEANLERKPRKLPSVAEVDAFLRANEPAPEADLLDAMERAHPGVSRETLSRIAEDAGF